MRSLYVVVHADHELQRVAIAPNFQPCVFYLIETRQPLRDKFAGGHQILIWGVAEVMGGISSGIKGIRDPLDLLGY